MGVSIRKYPYPYQAMLAICSDLDETPNQRIYFETSRYLNTTQQTSLGRGVGLEVGNSIYFDMPPDQFSYTNTDAQGRHNIHQLIDSGHIDCLHSFGDFVDSIPQIKAHWAVIQKGQRKLEVWIDHAQALTNLDNDIMQGQGAIVGSCVYHTHLTCAGNGIQFIWKGRVTSLIAQNATRNYSHILQRSHPIQSFKTLALEFIKGCVASLGSVKYAMHKDNKVLRKTQLVDGLPIMEFMRCNPSWGGVSVFDSTRGIDKVLTHAVLSQLHKKQGCSVLYTHLGKVFSAQQPFKPQTRQAFECLAAFHHEGKILVTTTRRLLGYQRTVDALRFEVKHHGNETAIYLHSAYRGEDLQGITWYVDDPAHTTLYHNGVPYPDLQLNAMDETGRVSVSIPWKKLTYPNLKGTQYV